MATVLEKMVPHIVKAFLENALPITDMDEVESKEIMESFAKLCKLQYEAHANLIMQNFAAYQQYGQL
eukprot:CAMPEP_0201281388 /NCGR_PEP_ID=MMETSP1317-20130820/2578_1 /ASSEMBLY_ACC=CAM_ASM_000770 /TAXON_ID=187299 /ORGANISM="Undescribed Undescribed, Strain Undescribed" /LENGTH=66 /DNA_ID=CAMNT_0047591063 /DNA_START=242 /DNA_END=442 /DNA_ORIENTATION=+